MSRFAIDLKGEVFGRWTVENRAEKKGHWWCKCACGTRRPVYGVNLRHGSSRSCGCGIERKPKPREPVVLKVVERRASYIRIHRLTIHEERAVMNAFDIALSRAEAIHRCYIAGVETITMSHPDWSREYAAKCAIEISLKRRMQHILSEEMH